MNELFSPYRLGRVTLKNRVVMAPMTRNRAIGNVVSDLHARYYTERAEAGLIVTEATAPSPNALGYPRIPALFDGAHVRAWREVTDAVHREQGTIFVQLMHVGRVAHPHNMPRGARVMAPSAFAAPGAMYTDAGGEQPFPVPTPMTEADIETAIEEHARASELALEAGFDGVEIHAANGFLVDQFLNRASNQRADRWGGTIENRIRFASEIVSRVSRRIGADRVGIRVSPFNTYNGMETDAAVEELYETLASTLRGLGIAYLHLVDFSSFGLPAPTPSVRNKIRDAFAGTLILSGGYDRARAEADLARGDGDLVAFGRPFIANPRLVTMLREGRALAEADPATFYTAGAKGYVEDAQPS